MTGHLVEDPLLLLLQVARRLPDRPSSALTRVLRLAARQHGTRATLRGALAAWLSGTPASAVETLSEVLARTTGPPRGLRDRVAGELAVQLGHPAVMGPALARAGATVRARAAWQRGR
ncbi:hypothetical protein [Cellulomonas sp. ATA003]|uniref:hypothetical protein n=1 Tax=Cellulomonas sp. ATA003 TaxID=3073064 RepID=UPI002872ADFD|nr:hypothetical protein [Cellulomonas sp. ATA003]WNB85186.1 hypothetical protein REH70_16340 [Cellulomonas sp. ATA003]